MESNQNNPQYYKVLVDGKEGRITKQKFEDNLDALIQRNPDGKVWVNNPDGQSGKIPMRQYRKALEKGYTPFFIDELPSPSQPSQESTQPQQNGPQPEQFSDYTKGNNIANIAHNLPGEQGQSMAQAIRQAVNQTEEAIAKTPKLPWQTDLEYTEKVAAESSKIQQRQQAEQAEYERQMAIPQTIEEIDMQIAQLDGQLREYDQQSMAIPTRAGDTAPNFGRLFNPNRKELSADQIAQREKLNEQKQALRMQRMFLDKIQQYQQYDKNNDRSRMNKLFEGMSINGDMAAFATFGLSQLYNDQQFIKILDKVDKGLDLTVDENKALILYQNMQQLASKNRGVWFNAGSGFQKTFEFMRDMALGGIGGGFKAIASQGLKETVKTLSKQFAKKALDIAWKTPLLPGFRTTLSENVINNYNLQNYGTDQKPQWNVDKLDSDGKLIYKTWAQNYSEYLTESMGAVFENIGIVSRIARSSGKAGAILNKAIKQYDRIHDATLHNSIGRILSQGFENIGLQNIPAEFMEEIINVPLQSLMMWDSKQLEQLANPAFYQEVGISTAALGGIVGAANMTIGGATAAIEKNKHSKALKQSLEAVNQIINSTGDDAKKAYLADLVNDLDSRNFYNEKGEFDGKKILSDLTKVSQYVTDAKDRASVQQLVKEALYKEGQTQALKAIMEDEYGSMEYGTSGDVWIGQDKDRNELFILGETADTYLVNDPKTKQQRFISKSDMIEDSFVIAPLYDIAGNYFINQAMPKNLETIEQVTQAEADIQQQTKRPNPIQRGDKVDYSGELVTVEDVYTDGKGNSTAIVIDSNDQTHNVPLSDLIKMDLSDKKRYLLPDGRRSVLYAYDNGMVLLDVLDDNNNVVERVQVPLDEFGTYDELTSEDAAAIESTPQQSVEPAQTQPNVEQPQTETLQQQPEVQTEAVQPAQSEVQIPLDKDGNTDFDALLETSPELFAQEYSKIVGPEETLTQLLEVASELDKQIKKKSNAAKKQTSFNKKAQMFSEISALKNRREALVSQIMKMTQPQAQIQNTVEGQTNAKGENVISKKWQDSQKVEGNTDVRTLPDGSQLKGRWVLAEADAATPSHNPHTLQPSEGFPTTAQGKNINDNDYTKKSAEVRIMAADYDGRAIDNPIFVKDGIVVSGNNRTMSGILAAENGTDSKYLQSLQQRAQALGFTQQQIDSFNHPRVFFEVEDDIPMTTEMFAKFNQRETKSKTPTERAIVASKRDNSRLVSLILSEIDKYEKLSDVYQNQNATSAIVRYMVETGLINNNEVAELYENGFFTANGKDFLESLLIGTVIGEDQIKILNTEGMKSFRGKIVKSIIPLIENTKLRQENQITGDLNQAILYLYQAKASSLSLDEYVRQNDMFERRLFDEDAVFVAIKLQQNEREFRSFVEQVNARLSVETPNMFTGQLENKQDIYGEFEQQLTESERAALNSARETNAQTKTLSSDGTGAITTRKELDGVLEESQPEDEIKPVGVGVFGNIYNQFKGKAKEAIVFLTKQRSGEAIGALTHPDVGEISLVWGNSKAGLEKIWNKHSEVLDDLQAIIQNMNVVQRSDNRIKLESPTHFAVISKDWKGTPREQWLLTAYEKKEMSVSGGSMDINPEPSGKQNDTAPLQNTHLSEDKVNEPSSDIQQKSEQTVLETAQNNALNQQIDQQAKQTDTNPTQAQKEAGNYKMGHVKVQGLDISIENPAGSVRSGVDQDGKSWSVTMNNHYGYIRGTKGKDKDHIDVFLGENLLSDKVYVVDQVNEDGAFDEHKVMIGFDSVDDAKAAYLSNYSDGWQGLGNITEVPMSEFKMWISNGTRKIKPFTEYKAYSLDAIKQQAEQYSQKYGTPVEVVESADQIKHPLARRAAEQGGLYGWYDIKTSKVFVYAPNILGRPDELEKTVLHEVVAHKGLRSLLGDTAFDKVCDAVWDMMSETDKIRYISYIKNIPTNMVDLNQIGQGLKDKREAADEYMASIAEDGITNPSVWEKIKRIILDALREVGINIPLTDADIAYMLYRSSKALQKNTTLMEQAAATKSVEAVEQSLSNPQTASQKGFDQPLKRREVDNLRWVDKEKVSDWFDTADLNSLIHTKLNDFENPTNIRLRYKTSQGKNVNFTQLSLFDQAQQSEQDPLLDKRLRPLQEGEFCHVERIFTQSKAFDFTSGEQIKSSDDVAYIFSQLENESIENAFAVLVKNGKPYVIHVGMGGFDASYFNIGAVVAADKLINADEIYMVHNHPSGALKASNEDVWMYNRFVATFGNRAKEGIIINLTSGRYGVFTDTTSSERDKATVESQVPIKLYSFNKQVFDYDFDPKQLFSVTGSSSVASFISSQRLGDRAKINILVLNRQNKIVGNILTEYKTVDMFGWQMDQLANQIVDYTIKMGGSSAIVYGSGVEMDQDMRNNLATISKKVKAFSGYTVEVLDWIYVSGKAMNYMSAIDEGIRFRKENSLIGLHNISEDKLVKAIRQGGLANPSAAVIDLNTQSHEGYGDISLIMPKSLVDKKTGRNVGTFTADAWTPTYPDVQKQISDKGRKAYRQALNDLDTPLKNRIALYFDNYLDSGILYDALFYWYALENGLNPELVTNDSGQYSKEELDKMMSILDGESSFWRLSAEKQQQIINMYKEYDGGVEESDAKSRRILEKLKSNVDNVEGLMKKRVQEKIELYEKYGLDITKVSDWVYKAIDAYKRFGEVNEYRTFDNAIKLVNDKNLRDDLYNRWLPEIEEKFDVKEFLYAGTDNQGRQKWLPNTLQNASRLMNRQQVAGGVGGASFNHFVAVTAPKATSLKQIKARQANLSNDGKYDQFRKKWENIYQDLALQLQPGASVWEDYGQWRMEELVDKRNPKAFAKSEYDIELSDEFLKNFSELISAIKNDFPARYFETKFARPVMLDEFVAAVVPDNTSESVIQALKDAGLNIGVYKVGDNAERKQLIEQFSDNNVRFRRVTAEMDAEYMAAVKSGDMRAAQDMVNQAAQEAGYDSNTSYQGSLAFNGAAPSQNAYFTTKDERKQAWENGEYEDTFSLGDYVDNNIDTHDLDWRLTDPRARMNEEYHTIESINNLKNAVRNGERTIKMFRAVPANVKENSFRNGDWVTPSRSYAQYHIGLQDWNKGRIIEQEVSIDDIWWNGDDINEWGFDDGKTYGYQNTKNNRKSLEAVTYDDNGNVIPLSKRFNNRNADIRFRTRPISDDEWQTYQQRLDEVDAQISQADGLVSQDLIDERGRIFYDVLRRLANEPFSIVSQIDFRETMEYVGADQDAINAVENIYNDPENITPSLYSEGQIFFLVENISSIEDLRLALVHERQHGITHQNWDYYYNEIINRVSGIEELRSAVSNISFGNYATADLSTLVDEFPSFAMMHVYSNANYPQRLQQLGVNDRLIDFVKQLDYGQKQNNNYINSRRWSQTNEIRNGIDLGSDRQDVRDQSEGSTEMDQQRAGSIPSSQGGTQGAEGEESINQTEDKIRFRYSPEMEQIKERAISDSTFMKAPNGNPSNLNEKQWLQVRTKAFKEWFGDWEKAARIQKLKDSEPVRISGTEVPASDEIGQYRKNAESYAKRLRGQYINKDTGEVVELTSSRKNGGIRELLHHDYKNVEHLQSVAAIPGIIENSIYITSLPNEDSKIDADYIDYFVCGLKIADEDYTVKSVIIKLKDGSRYYDHKLTNIEKGSLLDIINNKPDNASNPISSESSELPGLLSNNKDRRLFAILQDNSSKVVDENGEPMVVYHGTNAEFSKFDINKFGQTDLGSYGKGFYFTTRPERAKRYGENIIPVFINARNLINGMKDEALAFVFGSPTVADAKARLFDPNDNAMTQKEKETASGLITKELVEEAKKYDGVDGSTSRVKFDELVVINPNQIKSATDNTGEFSGENNDILFRYSPILNKVVDQMIMPQQIISDGLIKTLGQQRFDNMISDIYSDIPLLEKAADVKRGVSKQQAVAALVDKVCNNIDDNQVLFQQIIMAVKDALNDTGVVMMPDSDDLMVELWKATNLPQALTIKERLANGAAIRNIRLRVEKKAPPQTNQVKLSRMELWRERLLDRMISVNIFYNELKKLGIKISDDTDPYVTENLAMSRSQTEDAQFKKEIYQPLIEQVIEVENLFIKLGLAKDREDAYKKVNNLLYARHAPERNKNICVEEVMEKALRKISAEQMALFKDSDVRGVMTALISRMYNEKSSPSTPVTSDTFAKNMLLAKGADKKQQDQLNSFRGKFAGIVKDAKEDISNIFASERGTNRSGMTDQEAKDIMAMYYTQDTKQAVDKLSDWVRQSTHFTVDTWYKYSLIDDKTRDNIKKMYRYYIPLRSWEEKEDVDYDNLTNQAFNKASEIINLNRKASGRTSRAGDPLVYIASLAQSAIVIGNKNMIRLNLYRLIKSNQNVKGLDQYATLPKLYYVETPGSDVVIAYDERPAQELFDQNLVKTKTNKSYKWHKSGAEYDAHIVPVILNGTRQMIELRGELGVKVASAINNTNVLHWQAADALKPITNWLSAVRTSYNPEFILTNFARDFMFSNLVYPTEGGSAKELNKNLKQAFKSIHRLTKGKPVNSKWDAYYKEFLQEGGQTGFFAMRNIDQMRKEIEKMHKQLQSGKMSRHAIAKTLKGLAEYSNNMSESAMRLAVFITEREKGTSVKQAAYKAHEISVNFNRKGTWSGNFGGFYSFFNASMQGTSRLFTWVGQNKQKSLKSLAAITFVKLVTNIIAALVGGDDYDELSDYVKFSNIVIPIGTDSNDRTVFFCIPMAQGIRAVTNLADNVVDCLTGNKSVAEATKTQIVNTVGEFLPLSFDAIDLTGRNASYSIASAFTPTVVQPWMDIWVNMDFKGDPIYKEPFLGSQKGFTPEYKNVYGNTNPVLVGVSRYLNNMAGGSNERTSAIWKNKKGEVSKSPFGYMFDINPARTEHLLNAYLGGLMSFPSNVIKTAWAAFDSDTDVQLYNFPVVNRFAKKPYQKDGYQTYYQIRDYVEMTKNTISAARKEGDFEGAAVIQSRNIRLLEMFEAYDDRVKQLRGLLKSNDLSVQSRLKVEKDLDEIVNQAANQLQKILDDEKNTGN